MILNRGLDYLFAYHHFGTDVCISDFRVVLKIDDVRVEPRIAFNVQCTFCAIFACKWVDYKINAKNAAHFLLLHELFHPVVHISI